MISRWYRLKGAAITLRKKGLSIGKIEHRLGIPRSTLSSWFKDVQLTRWQREKLLRDWKNALVKARRKAVLWHNAQKEKRLQEAENSALKTLKNIDHNDISILELTLAILYLGEGTKKADDTAIGSSNPLILKFFLSLLRMVYDIDIRKIRCQLNLRADQDINQIKRFWARELKLPLINFKHIAKDKRTIGTKTYRDYKGVCQLRCGSVAIQRRLIALSHLFCQKIVENNKGL